MGCTGNVGCRYVCVCMLTQCNINPASNSKSNSNLKLCVMKQRRHIFPLINWFHITFCSFEYTIRLHLHLQFQLTMREEWKKQTKNKRCEENELKWWFFLYRNFIAGISIHLVFFQIYIHLSAGIRTIVWLTRAKRQCKCKKKWKIGNEINHCALCGFI